MLNFRKVVGRGSNTKNPNEKDQEKYLTKVGDLEKACLNFKKYLETVDEGTKFSEIIGAFEDKNKGFGNQMKKNKMVSRTSRVLHGMKKELLKFKNESFDPEKIGDYLKAFWFKAETANSKDYIKRSAIDDKQIARFFTSIDTNNSNNISGILNNIAKKKKRQTGTTSSKISISTKATNSTSKSTKPRPTSIIMDAFIMGVLGQAQASLETAEQCIAEAEKAKKTFDEKLEIIKGLENAANNEIKSYTNISNVMKGGLQSIIGKVEKTKNALKDDLNNLNKIWSNQSPTLKEQNRALTDIKNSKTDTDKAVKALKEKNARAANVVANFDYFINNCDKGGTFDSEEGIFTVRTENDFEKMKDYKDEIKKIIVEGNVKKFKRTCGTLNNLVEVKLGPNCTAIKKKSFYKHPKLTTINLENVQKIGKDAFYACEALKGGKNLIVDLSSATMIDEEAFKTCKNIENVRLGSNCKEIRYGTFSFCDKLALINLENVKTIEDEAFYFCSNLNHLNLTNVTKIGNDVFLNCGKLADVKCPTNAEANAKIGAFLKNKFTAEKGKAELSEDEKQIIISGKFDSGKLESFKDIESIEEMVVQNIQIIQSSGVFPYYLGTQLKKITLDKNCKVIGNSVFSGFKNLSEINLGNVRRIGSLSFSSTGLQDANLEQIEQVGYGAFSSCKQLTSVQLGNSFTKINKQTFLFCSSLSKINLGKINKIGQEAFCGCSSLTEVDLTSVETLEKDAFKGCTSLSKVVLPNKNAKKIKEAILNQVGKDQGKNIQFINDPDKEELNK